MSDFSLNINGEKVSVNAAADMPLLWVLRDKIGLMGTKYGCGLGICGICTVHINGEAIKACQVSVKECVGKEITTIEGLSPNGNHPVQEAWKECRVPQCGYCQTGQIMQAAALLKNNSNPKEKVVKKHMSKVLCRCGTYPRIKKAISMASQKLQK